MIAHSQPGPYWKIAKMALFNSCMDFRFLLDFLWSALKVWFSDFIQNLSQAPFMCLYLSINLGINWIISRIPRGISNILFVQGSYESLAMLDSKARQCPFSMIQYCKITVCTNSYAPATKHMWIGRGLVVHSQPKERDSK